MRLHESNVIFVNFHTLLQSTDEYEKYQIRSPESALIWNYKVSSTIKLAASGASSWADNYPQAIQPW